MSLLWLDGFANYSDEESMAPHYFDVQGASILHNTTGRRNRNAIEISVGTQYDYLLPSADNVIIIGFAIKPTIFPSTTMNLVVGSNSNNNTLLAQFVVRLNSDGTLELFRLGSFTEGSTSAITLNEWNYFEIKVDAQNAGSAEIKLNGSTEIDDVSGDYQNGTAGINHIRLGAVGLSLGNVQLTDYYVMNDSGSTNNDFIATTSYDVHVGSRLPTADGTTNDFTPLNAGDNYVEVNDVDGPDNDTTYNSSSTASNIDLYGMEDIESFPSSVLGVKLSNIVRKTDGTNRTIKNVTRQGGTNYESSETAGVSIQYGALTTIQETDPDTGVAWTEAGVNSAEFGVKLES
jgi:hypothetical protein